MTSGAKGDKGDTGAAGVDGKDGTTPRLRINAETNMWEVSYDNGVTWTSMGSEFIILQQRPAAITQLSTHFLTPAQEDGQVCGAPRPAKMVY